MSSVESNAPMPLDESLYQLEGTDYEFLSAETGIKDPEELKKHIIAVQAEIYKVRLRVYLSIEPVLTEVASLGPSLPLYPGIFVRKVSH